MEAIIYFNKYSSSCQEGNSQWGSDLLQSFFQKVLTCWQNEIQTVVGPSNIQTNYYVNTM